MQFGVNDNNLINGGNGSTKPDIPADNQAMSPIDSPAANTQLNDLSSVGSEKTYQPSQVGADLDPAVASVIATQPSSDLGYNSYGSQSSTDSMSQVQEAVAHLPQEASDSDLIEKEWVEVVEKVVQNTSSNPFEQQRQLSALRTEYMRKRYNKIVNKSGG